MRRVVGDRLVTDVLTTGRVEIASEAGVLMQEVLDKYDMGVKIVTVKLQDVNPPEVVKRSFNEVNEANKNKKRSLTKRKNFITRLFQKLEVKQNSLFLKLRVIQSL